MTHRNTIRLFLFCLMPAAAIGCRALDTFNAYPRVAVMDYQVHPSVAGRVADDRLPMLKEAATRWITATRLFAAVVPPDQAGPDTLFVEGVISAYRPDRIGYRVASAFGVNVRGRADITYTFRDAAGNIIYQRLIRSNYRYPAAMGDGTAEAAGHDLASFISWHKNIRHGP